MHRSGVFGYAILTSFVLLACSVDSRGIPCATGFDCADGVCGIDGLCAPKSGCDAGLPCPSGVCDVEGGCVPKSTCVEHQDCPSLECLPSGRCAPVVCGDALVQADEECDDGNAMEGDGCSPYCRREWIPIASSSDPVRVSGSRSGCWTTLSYASNGVAVDDYQNIYVVMVCGGGEAFVASSRDGGLTYGEPVGTGILGSSDVAIVAGERGQVFVAGLTENSLRYTWSTDAGASWERPILLDDNLNQFDVIFFGVTMRYRAGEVFVSVKDAPCSESSYVFVADGGSISRTDTELATCPGDLLLDPNGSDLWLLGDVGSLEISRSTDGGQSFQLQASELPTEGLFFDWAASNTAIFFGGFAESGSIYGRIAQSKLTKIVPIAGGTPGIIGERAIDVTSSGALFAAVAEGGTILIERVRPGGKAVDSDLRRFGELAHTPEILVLPKELGAVVAYTETANGAEEVYATVQRY